MKLVDYNRVLIKGLIIFKKTSSLVAPGYYSDIKFLK